MMSTDRAVLASLEARTEADLVYFEEVTAWQGNQKRLQCLFCIGRHALYFVRRNFDGLFPSDASGDIYYSLVTHLVEDERSSSLLVVALGSDRHADLEAKVFVVSATRKVLVNKLKVAWQTDYTWRFSKVAHLSVSFAPLADMSLMGDRLRASPFDGCQELSFQGYMFFLSEAFRELTHDDSTTRTLLFKDMERDISFQVFVNSAVSIDTLLDRGLDHIRWVAMEYKLAVSKPFRNVFCLRNNLYKKKMNLTNDLACWTGWEIFLKSESIASVTIILRRRCIPPTMDCAQDITLIASCPLSKMNMGLVSDMDLVQVAHLAADSLSPTVHDCTAYPTVFHNCVQARLDALLYDDESLQWIEQVMSMSPMHEQEARRFLKAVLKVLSDENALHAPELMNALSDVVPKFHEPMQVPEAMLSWASKLMGTEADAESLNSWYSRVARYFAHYIDGGAFGKRFTMSDLTDPIFSESVVERLSDVLHFLLHIRPVNMKIPYKKFTLVDYVNAPKLNDLIFNDSVMQSLSELGWAAKFLGTVDGSTDGMTKAHAKLLSRLLVSERTSANLKVSTCRQIIKAKNPHAHIQTFIPALMHLAQDGVLFVQTHAIVTLVNLTGGQEQAKNAVMAHVEIAPMCKAHLLSQDDDLILYTLVLLTNVTKNMQHRAVMEREGITAILVDLLKNSYGNKIREKILTELASVIGQLCNDDDTRLELAESKVINCFLHVFKSDASLHGKLKSKVMFALKQLAVHNPKVKEDVGKVVIRDVLSALMFMVVQKSQHFDASDMDWTANAVLLLVVLSTVPVNVKLMHANPHEKTSKIEEVLRALDRSVFGSLDTIEGWIKQLKEHLTGKHISRDL